MEEQTELGWQSPRHLVLSPLGFLSVADPSSGGPFSLLAVSDQCISPPPPANTHTHILAEMPCSFWARPSVDQPILMFSWKKKQKKRFRKSLGRPLSPFIYWSPLFIILILISLTSFLWNFSNNSDEYSLLYAYSYKVVFGGWVHFS